MVTSRNWEGKTAFQKYKFSSQSSSLPSQSLGRGIKILSSLLATGKPQSQSVQLTVARGTGASGPFQDAMFFCLAFPTKLSTRLIGALNIWCSQASLMGMQITELVTAAYSSCQRQVSTMVHTHGTLRLKVSPSPQNSYCNNGRKRSLDAKCRTVIIINVILIALLTLIFPISISLVTS